MDVAALVAAANQAMCTLLRRLGIVPTRFSDTAWEYSAMRAAGMADEEHNDERVVELNDQHGRQRFGNSRPKRGCRRWRGARPRRGLCKSIGCGRVRGDGQLPISEVVIADPRTAGVLEARLLDEVPSTTSAFDRSYHTPQFEPFAESLRCWNTGSWWPPVVPLIRA
jgi:hypothetical protein